MRLLTGRTQIFITLLAMTSGKLILNIQYVNKLKIKELIIKYLKSIFDVKVEKQILLYQLLLITASIKA